QTEQDKQRVLDGLQGASAESGGGFDRERISEILSGVGKRVFMMHNVHDSHPVTFHTRWALSYLAGPMTRTQIKALMDGKKTNLAQEDSYAEAAPAMPSAPVEQAAAPAPEPPPEPQRPVLPPDISQVYLPIRRAYRGDDITFEPRFLAMGRIHFVDTRKGLSADEELAMLTSLDGGAFGIDWDDALHLDMDSDELESDPPEPGSHAEVPAEASKGKSFTAWKKSLADHIYRSRRFVLLKCAATKEISEPGESERDFRIRISEEVREKRDEEVEKLRKKYTSKINTLEERIRKAELRVEREQQEASGAKMQTAISFGATVLSAVLGRKTFSSTTVGRAASAARGIGRSAKQADDVRRAQADVDSYQQKLEDLVSELESEIEEIEDKYDADSLELDELLLKPRKTDIDIRHVALAWVPFGRDAAGTKIPLFRD
ncbi:MAG: ATP-binding protein, partial [Planctomycetota bacterium]